MTGSAESSKADELIEDVGPILNHPELIQPHPSASREWYDEHKVLTLAALGGTACFIAGVVTKGVAVHHRLATA